MGGQVAGLNKAGLNELARRGPAKVLADPGQGSLEEPPSYDSTWYTVRRTYSTALCRHDDQQRPPALPNELRPGCRREMEHAVLSGPKKSLCSSTRISV